MGSVPSDATMLLVFHEQIPEGWKVEVEKSMPLVDGNGISFAGLGGGLVDDSPGRFRRFRGWWIEVDAGRVQSLEVSVMVGPDAGAE